MRTWACGVEATQYPTINDILGCTLCLCYTCTYVEVDQAAGQECEEAAVKVPHQVRHPDRGVVGAATLLPLFFTLQLPLPSLSFLFECFMVL